jgi:hypothetical protein
MNVVFISRLNPLAFTALARHLIRNNREFIAYPTKTVLLLSLPLLLRELVLLAVFSTLLRADFGL